MAQSALIEDQEGKTEEKGFGEEYHTILAKPDYHEKNDIAMI